MKILLCLALALLLTACSQSARNPESTADSATTSVLTEPKATPAPEVRVESTGDIEADVDQIETEINNLNIDTDFPEIDQSDFE